MRFRIEETDVGYVESPIGLIEVAGTGTGILSVVFVEEPWPDACSNDVVDMAAEQLGEYLAGTRRAFDLPLDLQGSDFQQQVWEQLLTIPYGQTASYQAVAQAIDRPRAVRAVGAANARNPISIVVPCHRVIGSDGSLTGYGGGLWRKAWLLRHEGILRCEGLRGSSCPAWHRTGDW
jgi:methylated-DNA-[protein]-cysteine S-methyltransferase